MNISISYIKNSNRYALFTLLFLLSIGLGHLFPWLCEITHGDCNIEQLKRNDSLGYIILVSVVIAPLLETLVCQLFVIEVTLLYKGRYRENIAVLFSGIVFALGHSAYGNYWFTINTFLSGMILAIIYIVFKANHKYPFGVTTLFHGLFNLYVCLLDLL